MQHWDLPAPHLLELQVRPQDIDAYGHVNNAVYLSWLDSVAWAHSAALGIPLERCVQVRRGMAAQRIQIEYLRAAFANETLQAATWIVGSDGRLRVRRHFQLLRRADACTLARAQVDYVCINLDSGRAARMPEEFSRAYAVTVPQAAASAFRN